MPDGEGANPADELDLGGVTVLGRIGSEVLSGRWQLVYRDETVRLSRGERTLTLPTRSLTGAVHEGGSLELPFADGSRIALSGSDRLGELASALDKGELRVGELMRASRTLGSRRARPGTDHDTFFAPFLAARRSLAKADGLLPPARIELPEVRQLRSAVVDALNSIALTHFPSQAADRRALVAELDDCAAPLFVALDQLDAAAALARGADAGNRYVAWREWKRALAECFSRAESSWMTMLPALDEAGEVDTGAHDVTARSEGQ